VVKHVKTRWINRYLGRGRQEKGGQINYCPIHHWYGVVFFNVHINRSQRQVQATFLTLSLFQAELYIWYTNYLSRWPFPYHWTFQNIRPLTICTYFATTYSTDLVLGDEVSTKGSTTLNLYKAVLSPIFNENRICSLTACNIDL